MNNSIAVTDERAAWPLQPYARAPGAQLGPGQRVYSAANMLDLNTVLRIIQHWRWLILGAVALGVAGAIILTLLTTPIYRAKVILEVNPPTVYVNESDVGDTPVVPPPEVPTLSVTGTCTAVPLAGVMTTFPV